MIHPRFALLAAALLLVGSVAGPLVGEERCDLKALTEAYKIGQFDQVLAGVPSCLQPGGDPQLLEQAYALLAKAYVAQDDLAHADETIALLLAVDPGWNPAFDDPPQFVRRVKAARRAGSSVFVTSVSRTHEKLREAPATVVVISAEDLARRGYLDLEQVFHDLPGFDVTRGNGDVYSLFYQRGYVSRNQRTLLLVDGVEENNLWDNVAHLSRQYPLSNVERIEVIYGPASTMYGANAFAGVIHILTKNPETLFAEGQKVAVHAQVGGGSWNTGFADATVAGRRLDRDLAFSLTVRDYRSDEMDLSRFPDWSFDPAAYDRLDYSGSASLVRGADAIEKFLAGLSADQRELEKRYFRTTADPDGTPVLRLTPEGAARARALDVQALARQVEGRPVGFSDLTRDWLVSGKLQSTNLTLGFETWRREEGDSSWYTDKFYSGAQNGNLWIPLQTALYLRYDRDLGPRLGFHVLSSYQRHILASDTRQEQLVSYWNGGLKASDLLSGTAAFWRATYYDLLSTQFDSEVTAVYNAPPKWSLVAGFQAKSSLIQEDYVTRVKNNPNPLDDHGANPAKYADQLDAGAFVQASYTPREHWKLVLGGRLDKNDDRLTGGYGTVFNPRLAAIYSRGSWVWKAIYAQAFEQPSSFDRYSVSTGVRDLPNPALKPERAKNLEVSAGWQRGDDLTFDLAAYTARYENTVIAESVPFEGGTTLQNHAIGSLRIAGLEARMKWRVRIWEVDANYTYTDPRNTHPTDASGQPLLDAMGRPVDSLPLGAVARHHVNLGASARLRPHLDWNLRFNYVGERRTGPDSVVEAPDSSIAPYWVANTALTWELRPALQLQLTIDNLFDREYFDPGIGSADGIVFARRLPQNRRSLFARLRYDL